MTGLAGIRLIPASTAIDETGQLAAVAAPVRDPLWLLGRQLQTGALLAEDGGPPVTVTMAHAEAPVRLGGSEITIPLEPLVEAERLTAAALDTRTRIRFSSELFRRLGDGGVADSNITAIRAALASAFPLTVEGTTGALDAFAGAVPDAGALYSTWSAAFGPDGSAGALPDIPGLTAARAHILEPVARTWVAWLASRLDQGTSAGSAARAPRAWRGETVGYEVGLDAKLGGQSLDLVAPDYDGAGIDWHSFDRSTPAAVPLSSTPAVAVRPTRVGYRGMPEPGFWTIEDGDVNLDLLASDDPARALLIDFAHSYSNDWFLVPLSVAPGVVLITGITVVDSFGTTTQVPAAVVSDAGRTRFALWELGVSPTAGGTAVPTLGATDPGAGVRVFLPSSPPPLEGPVLEDIVLARDELANLGWAIELTTTDGDGQPVDRYRRWLTARGSSGPDSSNPGGPGAYRLGTAVPDHWYPLEAAETTADGHRRLRLAELPPGASDVSDAGVRGVVVDHRAGAAVDEEEVSRGGTRVTRVDRLGYSAAGRTVWRARRVGAGTGEATSGLRFDVIEPAD